VLQQDAVPVTATACAADLQRPRSQQGVAGDDSLEAPPVCTCDVWVCSDQDPMQMLVRYGYRRLEESCAALHGAVHRTT
jgi:hypothetical protein